MINDFERMLVCGICGEPATCGFGVDVDGIRMGDVGQWRCSEHCPDRQAANSREEWQVARAEGRLYPGSPPGQWQRLGDLADVAMRKLSKGEAAE